MNIKLYARNASCLRCKWHFIILYAAVTFSALETKVQGTVKRNLQSRAINRHKINGRFYRNKIGDRKHSRGIPTPREFDKLINAQQACCFFTGFEKFAVERSTRAETTRADK